MSEEGRSIPSAELDALLESIKAVDCADLACPVRMARLSIPVCPKCRATTKDSCRLIDSAHYEVIRTARVLADAIKDRGEQS